MALQTSIQPTVTSAMRDAMLKALTTVPTGPVAGAALSVALIKDQTFAPNHNSTVADCKAHECDFTGYAENATAVFSPTNTSAPGGRSITSAMDFIATAPVAPATFVSNTVYGYFVYSGTNLVTVEMLPTNLSVPIASPGDFVSLTVLVPLDALQGA